MMKAFRLFSSPGLLTVLGIAQVGVGQESIALDVKPGRSAAPERGGAR